MYIHIKLGDRIRPLLPAIRNISYCKRIQGKLNRGEQQHQQRQPSTFQQQQQYYQLQQFQQQQSYLGSIMGGNNANGVHPLMMSNDYPTIPTTTSTTTATPPSFVMNGGHYPYSASTANPSSSC